MQHGVYFVDSPLLPVFVWFSFHTYTHPISTTGLAERPVLIITVMVLVCLLNIYSSTHTIPGLHLYEGARGGREVRADCGWVCVPPLAATFFDALAGRLKIYWVLIIQDPRQCCIISYEYFD